MPDDRPNSQPTTRRAKDGRGAASDLAATQDPRFHEIPRERVADRVAQELLRLIAGGSLEPGERLPGERQLAQMMNVSRVSVRAALQQLKAQGLVSATQGGSTRIIASSESLDRGLGRLVRADLRNLLDLAELRAQLEAWAARRAARLAKPEQIEEIARLFEVMADPARDHRLRLLFPSLAKSDRVEPNDGESRLPIENAVRMAKHGASIEELVRGCGLNIGEAQLMRKLHGQSRAAAQG